MDIMAFVEAVRELCHNPWSGDTIFSRWGRCKEASQNSWKFWKKVLSFLKGQIHGLLNSSFRTNPLDALLLAYPLVSSVFVSTSSSSETSSSKVEVPRPEISRSPPKRFIPLPDVEIGGYARSDTSSPAI
jgi:hypothetical protein